jgi:hypothetical protein
MDVPLMPYVALYGTAHGDWRQSAAAALDHAGVAWYDPTEAAWASIDETNGDVRQSEIDVLVKKELSALTGASCVVFHLTGGEGPGTRVAGSAPRSLASRFELGFVAGRKITTFVHIEPDVEGRHYLLAQIRLCGASMTSCTSLDAAVASAVGFMRQPPNMNP